MPNSLTALAKNTPDPIRGHLMRYRYGLQPSFAPEQAPQTALLHPITVHSTHHKHMLLLVPGPPSVTLKSPLRQQTPIIIRSPYQPPVHSALAETLVHNIRSLLLLPPRSAHSAPPHPFTQALLRNTVAPLPTLVHVHRSTHHLPFSPQLNSVGTS